MTDQQHPQNPPYAATGAQVPAAPYQQYSTPPAPAANSIGRAGFILGLIAMAISLAANATAQILFRTVGGAVAGAVSGTASLLVLALGIAALICGLVGLRRVGAPHGLAGIGAGIGLAITIGVISSFLISTVSSFLVY